MSEDRDVFNKAEADLGQLKSKLQLNFDNLLTIFLLILAKDLNVSLPDVFQGLTTNYAAFLLGAGDYNSEKESIAAYVGRVGTDLQTFQYVLLTKIAAARTIAGVSQAITTTLPPAPYIPLLPRRPNPFPSNSLSPTPTPAPTPTPTPTPPALPGLVSTLSALSNAGAVGSTITLNLAVTVPAGRSVSKVEFYEGTTKLGESTSAPPLTFGYSLASEGVKSVTARVFDGSATPVQSTSNTLTITVTPAVVTKTIYVDATAGNDSSTGATQAAAVQTLAKVNTLLENNATVYLKRGQTFRGTIFIDLVNGITVDAYGTGKHPILEGTEPITKANFTLTSGQTNTYQVAWTIPDTTITNCSEMGARVWEVSGGVETALTQRATIAAVEANPGSYFSDLTNNLLYVHSSNSSSPVSNSFVYEACKYAGGIQAATNRSGGTRDHTVKNIRTKRHGANNGGIVLGQECSIINCVCEWGGKHHAFLSSGTIDTLYLYKGKAAQNPMIFYATDAFSGGSQSLFVSNLKVIDVDDATGAVIYCHLNSGEQYITVQFDDCAIVRPNKTSGYNWGSLFESEKVILNNCLSIGGEIGLGIDSNPDLVEINGCEFLNSSGAKAVQRFNATYAYDLKIKNTVIWGGFATYLSGVRTAIENCVLYQTISVVTPGYQIPSLSFKNNVVTRLGGEFVWDFWVAKPDVIDSNNNLYSLADGSSGQDRWMRVAFGGGSTLAEWQAMQAQDANTVVESPIKWSGNPANRQYTLANNSAGVALAAGLLNTFSPQYPGMTPSQIEAAIRAEADAL